MKNMGYCEYPPQEMRRSLPDYEQGAPAEVPLVVPTDAGLSSPVVTTMNFIVDPQLEKALRAALGRHEDEEKPALSSPPLSPRERQTLLLVAQGLSNEEIARQLGLRLITVGKTLTRVYRKLGAQNRAEAVRRYLLPDGY